MPKINELIIKTHNLTACKIKMESGALTELQCFIIFGDIPCGKGYKWQQWSTACRAACIKFAHPWLPCAVLSLE